MKVNRIPQHETISRRKTAALQRVEKLRPLLEPILRGADVPPAFSAVALVESGGNPAALSPKGARGLWQLMPNTARRYGLEVSVNRDERLDVVKSSQAAAHYLHDLYVRFGSWALALAAYNAGEDAVQRGLDRARAKDFFSLSRLKFLPEETRKYVPAVFSSMKLFDDSVPVPDSSRRPAIGGVVSYALSQPQY
ncbi:MAG: lytic transglycosylase domain-containing protein [Actinomycetota bacterium]